MKPPRDLLFARHQAALPKLDAIRHSAVAAVCGRRPLADHVHERRSQTAATTRNWAERLVSSLLGCSNKLWRELVWPCRRTWTGLAAVWVLLFLVNFSQRDNSRSNYEKSPLSVPMMMSFRDQQKTLNELFADRSLPVENDRPRIFSPKPRTERSEVVTV